MQSMLFCLLNLAIEFGIVPVSYHGEYLLIVNIWIINKQLRKYIQQI